MQTVCLVPLNWYDLWLFVKVGERIIFLFEDDAIHCLKVFKCKGIISYTFKEEVKHLGTKFYCLNIWCFPKGKKYITK